jgi:hypothetical protein
VRVDYAPVVVADGAVAGDHAAHGRGLLGGGVHNGLDHRVFHVRLEPLGLPSRLDGACRVLPGLVIVALPGLFERLGVAGLLEELGFLGADGLGAAVDCVGEVLHGCLNTGLCGNHIIAAGAAGENRAIFGGLALIGVVFDVVRAGAKAIHGLHEEAVVAPALDARGVIGVDDHGIGADVVVSAIWRRCLERSVRLRRLVSRGSSGQWSRRRENDYGEKHVLHQRNYLRRILARIGCEIKNNHGQAVVIRL